MKDKQRVRVKKSADKVDCKKQFIGKEVAAMVEFLALTMLIVRLVGCVEWSAIICRIA